MSVPPPSCTPNSTSTGSASSSVRSTIAVSKQTSLVVDHRQRGHHGREDRGIDDRGRHRARLVDAQDHARRDRRCVAGLAREADQPLRARWSGARPASGGGWPGWCAASRYRRSAAGCVRVARSRARRGSPRRSRCASRSISSSTTLPTTMRAVSLVLSRHRGAQRDEIGDQVDVGLERWRGIPAPAACAFRPSARRRRVWITCTTGAGKNSRMSPSQRATRGADAPSPPLAPARRPSPRP